jgi:hypothetical protein
MDKYIPIKKRSKKAKQELAKARRGTWGALNPVTRKPANPKAYNRRKTRREEDFFNGGFGFVMRNIRIVKICTPLKLSLNDSNCTYLSLEELMCSFPPAIALV